MDKFFCSFDSSIRLLRIKGSATTFANISTQIECLTDRYLNLSSFVCLTDKIIPSSQLDFFFPPNCRRFTYSHLAQLKFILPEAIEVKKILTHDERTNCMKPDLHLSLSHDAIGNNGKIKSESGNLQLRKVFRARLCDFFKAHPEVCIFSFKNFT